MTEERKDTIEIIVKVVGTLVALFGIWEFFRGQEVNRAKDAQEKSIGYIERYASPEMLASREALFEFWLSQQPFIEHIESNPITERAYDNFVHFTFPRYTKRAKLQSALFSMANLYDQIFYCRKTGICDAVILDDHFCSVVMKQEHVYRPFFEIMGGSVGSTDFASGLKRYAELCRK
jgi:hypothetical protein